MFAEDTAFVAHNSQDAQEIIPPVSRNLQKNLD